MLINIAIAEFITSKEYLLGLADSPSSDKRN